MNTNPIIYIDLDETLVHTQFNKDYEYDIANKFDTFWYYTKMRPIALDLIEFCRGITHTKILTNSTRNYASIICDLLNFNFKYEDLICRYDYLEYVPSNWNSDIEVPIVINNLNQPRAILIDNMYDDDPGAIQKMQYLGINKSRYIQIRDYLGYDLEKFDDEYNNIKTRIKELYETKN